MPVQIFQSQKPDLHPLESKDLKPGLIYEGSDGLLYVGINHSNITDHQGHLVHADGIDHHGYATSDAEGEEITFREVNATITYK